MSKKEFTLKLNSKETVKVEFEGSDEIVDAFAKIVFTDSFGIFYKLKDEFQKLFLNGIQVRMKTVFADMQGREVSPERIVAEANQSIGIPVAAAVKRGRGRPRKLLTPPV